MAIDPSIKKKADDIRNKVYGKEVRESLASGLEEMSGDVVETVGRQDEVESQFQDVIENTTDKDVISAPEIIAARNGESNLKARLDKENQEVTAQLEQKTQHFTSIKEYEDFKIGNDWAPVFNKIINDMVDGGVILIPTGEYYVESTITIPTGRTITIQGTDNSHDGSTVKSTKIVLNHENDGFIIHGQGTALEKLSILRKLETDSTVSTVVVQTSYSKIDGCNIDVSGGIGVNYNDDNETYGVYFNSMYDTNVTGLGKMLVYNGRACTVNYVKGGKIRSNTTGGIFLENQTAGNTFVSVDVEGNSNGTGIKIDSPTNKFIACHVEDNLIGIDISVGSNYFFGVQPVAYTGQTAWKGNGKPRITNMSTDNVDGNFRTNLQIPGFLFGNDVLSGGVSSFLDIPYINDTSYGFINLLNKTPITGRKRFKIWNYQNGEYNNLFSVETTNSVNVTDVNIGTGNTKIKKTSVNPEGDDIYGIADLGSLAMYRGYGNSYNSSPGVYGSLMVKLLNNDSPLGWKELQPIFSGTTAQRPYNPTIGFQYFDTTLGKPIWHKGSAEWVDSNGVVV